MSKAKRDGAGIPLRVYKPNTSRLAIFLIGLYLFSIPVSYFMFKDDLVYGKTCLVGFLSLLAFALWIGFMSQKRSYIEIYENGLMAYSPLQRVFSTWSNLKSFEQWYDRHRGNYLVIKTYESVTNLREHGSEGQKYIPLFMVHLPLNNGSIDKEALLKRDFGQDLQHFAPHLFE